MVKGVNKRIVEINHTEDDYFERAILFVNHEKISATSEELSKEAARYLKELGLKQVADSATIRKRRRIAFIAAGLFCVLAVTLVIVLF